MPGLGNFSSRVNDSESSTSDPGSQPAAIIIIVLKTFVFIITITATLVGNCFIYAAMVKFKTLRTPTNIVLVSLATTDLGMVVIMVLHAVTDLSEQWIFGPLCCYIIATLGLVLSFISILHLCFLSIDRYLAIHRPLRYRFLVTKRRVFIALAVAWVLPSTSSNLPVADYQYRSEIYGCVVPTPTAGALNPFIFILIVVFVVIPFGIMLCTHACVLKVALTHARKLSAVERSLRRNNHDNTTLNSRGNRAHEIQLVRREIKSAKTFALVIGVFLFCYTPFFTAGTYRKFAGPEAVPDVVIFITTWVAFANSFSNPLVYSLRYSPFKKAFRKLCQCNKRKPRDFSNINSTTQASTLSQPRESYLNTELEKTQTESTTTVNTVL